MVWKGAAAAPSTSFVYTVTVPMSRIFLFPPYSMDPDDPVVRAFFCGFKKTLMKSS